MASQLSMSKCPWEGKIAFKCRSYFHRKYFQQTILKGAITHSLAFLTRTLYLFLIIYHVTKMPTLLHCVRLDSSSWTDDPQRGTRLPRSTWPSPRCAHTALLNSPRVNRRPLSPCHFYFLLTTVLSHDCLGIRWTLICSFSYMAWGWLHLFN